MDEEFYGGLEGYASAISWEVQPLPDLGCRCRPGDYPLMLVTYDRSGRRRVCFRPFGDFGDCDMCVRLLRKVARLRPGTAVDA